MPEIAEIPFYMRCFVTCQIVLVVHHPKKRREEEERKKKTSEVFCHSMYIYIQGRMCSFLWPYFILGICARILHFFTYKNNVN